MGTAAATAIIGLVVALIPLIAWWIKRKVEKADDPKVQNQKRREGIAHEIISRDRVAANRSLNDDLERLRALQGDRSGSGDTAGKGR